MVFHVPSPCVKVRRLRLRPGHEHHASRPAIALLETWRDSLESVTTNVPALHAAALATERAGGNLEDAARVCVVVGAGAVAENARAGSREHPLGQRGGIPMLDFIECFDDAAPVGDRR